MFENQIEICKKFHYYNLVKCERVNSDVASLLFSFIDNNNILVCINFEVLFCMFNYNN